MLRVEGMASTYEKKVALLIRKSGKIWPVDTATVFPLAQSIGRMPTEKSAN